VGFHFGRNVSAAVFEQTLPYIINQTSPGVAVYCLYGTGVPTISAAVYATDDLSDVPLVRRDDLSDGVVHLASLRVCEKWPNTSVSTYFNVTHTGILGDATAVRDVVAYIRAHLAEHDQLRRRRASPST
jgi:hypothetical protein